MVDRDDIIRYMLNKSRISLEELMTKFSLDCKSANELMIGFVHEGYFSSEKDGVFYLNKDKQKEFIEKEKTQSKEIEQMEHGDDEDSYLPKDDSPSIGTMLNEMLNSSDVFNDWFNKDKEKKDNINNKANKGDVHYCLLNESGDCVRVEASKNACTVLLLMRAKKANREKFKKCFPNFFYGNETPIQQIQVNNYEYYFILDDKKEMISPFMEYGKSESDDLRCSLELSSKTGSFIYILLKAKQN